MPLITFKAGTYEGELDEHKLPHGSGVWKSQSGSDNYKGTWQHGKPHGKGTVKGVIDEKKSAAYKKFATTVYGTSSDVQTGEFTYEGEWNNGKMSGSGLYTFPTGDFYDGDWSNNLANGTGMYIWASTGNRYQGMWRNMMKNGTGTYCFQDGTKFDGIWLNDKRHGKGTESFANGNRYEGYWVNDKRHGIGFSTIQKKAEKKKKVTGKLFQVFEQVFEHGVRKSEKELDAIPTVFPDPPLELKDSLDLKLTEIDKLVNENPNEVDQVFVEALIQWKDSSWTSIEELFLIQIKNRVELQNLKQLHKLLQEIDLKMSKTLEFQIMIDKLHKALSQEKADMLYYLKEANRLLAQDEELPGDDAPEDIFKIQVQVKISSLEEEIHTIKNENLKTAQSLIGDKDIKSKLEEMTAQLSDLEKRAFRTDSSIASSRLNANVDPVVKADAPNYEEVAKIVNQHLGRLKHIILQIAAGKIGDKQDEDIKTSRFLLLDRILDKCKTSINNNIDKISPSGASPSSIMDRFSRLVKLASQEA